MSAPVETTDPPSIPAALKRVAQAKPDAPAVTFEGETLSWQALHRRSNRMARALAAQGVRFGDFVTVALPNSPGFIEACYAIWKLGATPQPVSSRLPQAELDAIVALAKTPLVIGAGGLRTRKPVFSAEALLAASRDDSDLPDAVSPSWKAPTSGGSTGRPKLIVSAQPAVVGRGRCGPVADRAGRCGADAGAALSQRSADHRLLCPAGRRACGGDAEIRCRSDAGIDRTPSRQLGLFRADHDGPHLAPARRGAGADTTSPACARSGIWPRPARPGSRKPGSNGWAPMWCGSFTAAPKASLRPRSADANG